MTSRKHNEIYRDITTRILRVTPEKGIEFTPAHKTIYVSAGFRWYGTRGPGMVGGTVCTLFVLM